MAGTTAHALFIILSVEIGHLDDQTAGSPYLAEGSIIQIIGSADATLGSGGINFVEWTPGVYLPNTTVGNDTILATIPVGYGGYGAGQFLWSIDNYDENAYPYVYIRFFNTNSFLAATGVFTLAWGTSAVVQVTSTNYYDGFISQIDFSDLDNNGSGVTLPMTQTNSFTVIPEPSAVTFFALMGGMSLAMRRQIMRRRRREKLDASEDNPTATPSD